MTTPRPESSNQGALSLSFFFSLLNKTDLKARLLRFFSFFLFFFIRGLAGILRGASYGHVLPRRKCITRGFTGSYSVLKMDRPVILAATPHASNGLKNTNTRRGGEIIIAILVGFAQTPGNDAE